jgi:EpsI family protein
MLIPAAATSVVVGKAGAAHHAVIDSHSLPATVGSWTSEARPLTNEEEATLENPPSCQRIYVGPEGQVVQVLLLQMSKSQNVHDPKLCMYGDGYRLDRDQAIPAPWSAGSGEQVRQAIFTKGSIGASMTYWVQTPDGASANIGASLRASTFLGMLAGKGMEGIAVRVTSIGKSGIQTAADATALWKGLATEMNFSELARSLQ